MRLNIPFPDLKDQLQILINDGHDLRDKPITTELELIDYENLINEWRKNTLQFLSQCFSGENQDYFQKHFKTSIGIVKVPLHLPHYQNTKNIKDAMFRAIQTLVGTLKYIEISDVLINPSKIENEKRHEWRIKEKQLFILKTLNRLGHGLYYDIEYLYNANGLTKPVLLSRGK